MDVAETGVRRRCSVTREAITSQTSMHVVTTIPTLPSDRQLADAVRTGSDAAWNELVSRHVASVRAVLASRRDRRALEHHLDELRHSIEHDDGTDEGEPAVRAFRPRALATCSGGTYGPTPPHSRDDPSTPPPPSDSASVTDEELLALAFARLPEPWQTVLWHSHVERLTAAEISPLVGRTTIEVAELISTAERGLVDAFLLEYVDLGPLSPEAARVVPLLGGHVRGTLPLQDQRLVDRHFAGPRSGDDHQRSRTGFPRGDRSPDLAADIVPVAAADTVAQGTFAPPSVRRHDASDSRRLVGFASALDEHLARAIAPGVTGLSVEAHRKALGTSSRSFGSATLLAARSDRFRRVTLVGAAAAVVLVLIGAAYLIRKPFDSGDTVVTSGEQPTATAPVATEPDTSVDTTDDPADDPADDTVVTEDAPVPPTTVLDLRPAPTGSANEIEIRVDDGNRPLGVVGTAADIEISLSSPAPIFAGGTGTIDLAVANRSAEPTEATLQFDVPSGVTFDALAEGDAQCTDPDDGSSFCNVVVDADTTLDLAVRFSLESRIVGRFVVDGDRVAEPLEEQIVATGSLVHNSVGYGGISMIGNSLMTCDDAAAAGLGIDCDAVRDGTGELVNRWDVPMEFIGADPESGFVNSSAATLAVPETASIVSAHLYWSGDLDESGQSIPDDGSNAGVSLMDPSGLVTPIVADELTLGDVDATQYLGSADVTSLVAAGGAGEYLVANVRSVEVQGSYAAWSMVVVYDDAAAPRRERVVTRPFFWTAPEPRSEYGVDLPVPVVTRGRADLSMLVLEGERGFAPEGLEIGGTVVGGSSVFDSSIVGERSPMYENNLGVGIDTYDQTIDTPDGTLPIRATSEKDGVRIAVLALSVDLAP